MDRSRWKRDRGRPALLLPRRSDLLPGARGRVEASGPSGHGYTPATSAGLAKEIGSLEAGKYADLVVIDERVNVYSTMVHGEVVYETDTPTR